MIRAEFIEVPPLFLLRPPEVERKFGWMAPASGRSPTLALVASFVLLGLILLLDANTGPEFSLSILYLLPVILASWAAMRGAGYFVAVLAAAIWFVTDAAYVSYPNPFAPYWNAFARLGILTVLAATISRLRSLLGTLDQQVRDRTQELHRSIHELERFTYAMAHDLRAPLRALHGYSDILLSEHRDHLAPEARNYLLRIDVASRKMDRLVLDLLDYARLIHGSVPQQTVDLSERIRGILAEMKPVLEDRKARVDVDDPLPRVLGAPLLLDRVIGHLITNAVTYVEPDRPPHVRVHARVTPERAVILIDDNGVGIAPEYHQRIFEPFQHLQPAGMDYGTGMGLAFVSKAVERMNGRVGLESQPGRGSRFWIELPLSRVA